MRLPREMSVSTWIPYEEWSYSDDFGDLLLGHAAVRALHISWEITTPRRRSLVHELLLMRGRC